MKDSQIIIKKFTSKVLEGNPRNDPVTRKLPVYLPPDYDENQSYPTVYILTGIGYRGMKLLNDSIWEENIQDQLDRLITTKKMIPMIAILPDCSTSLGGAQYLNTSAQGNYQDYLLEIVEYVDQQFPTIKSRDFRAIMGHSSGGFGATRIAMAHPEKFGYVADHSGDKVFETSCKPDFFPFVREVVKMGAEAFNEFVKDPIDAWTYKKPFILANTIAVAACYSPNPDSSYGFDLPFDLETAEIIPAVWQKWLDNDPLHLLTKHADALRSLNLYYLDCGLFDEHNLQFCSRIYTRELNKLNIPHFYEEFPDGHNSIRYRYDVSLKMFSEKMQSIKK